MKTLPAVTEPHIKVETGKLAADATAGTNVTLTLENNDGLATTDFIVIGSYGQKLVTA